MIKTITFLILLLPAAIVMNTQETPRAKTYSFEQLDRAFEEKNKPAVVFLHTEWCRYCKAMEQDTFTDKDLIKVLNRDFYFVPFDAENKKDVIFRNTKFSYQPTGHKTGIHQMAQELLSQSKDKSYPVTLVINKKLEILYQYSGFLNQQEMLKILSQFN